MGAPKWTAGRWNWWTSNSWRRLRSEVSPGVSTNVLWPFTNPADGHADIDVTKEDMALIAAAPDLAEACRMLVESYDADMGTYALGKLYEAREAARAALSKARGETE